jgi:hypothetical protein
MPSSFENSKQRTKIALQPDYEHDSTVRKTSDEESFSRFGDGGPDSKRFWW